MQATGSNKIRTLQCLRAIAVILVLHSHLIDRQPGNGSLPWQAHFYYLQNVGAVGVDIFFVISGFIITIISRQYASTGNAGLFIVKRMLRVVPLYWLVSIYLIVRSLIVQHQWLPGPSILKTFLFIPFSDKYDFKLAVLDVGWTLSFEILFYLVVAIFMKVSGKKYLLWVILFFSGFIILNYVFNSHNIIMLKFTGNPIIIEFLLGMLLGIIYLHAEKLSPVFLWICMIAGIALLLTTIFTGYGDASNASVTLNGKFSLLRVIVWGVPAALIVGGAVMLEKKGKLSVHPLLVQTGDASYAIYLSHMIVLIVLYVRWDRWGLTNTVAPDLLILITLVLCVIAGYLFYRLVEKPLLALLQRRLR